MSDSPAHTTLPRVTIITATYNSERTIHDTLVSVALQDYPHIEHLIIDGLSRDKTLEIIGQFPHVSKIISEKDNGIYDAMNKGIRHATGEIIGILNSDDFYVAHDIISEVVKAMLNDQAETLYADLVYVHTEHTSKIIRTWIAGRFAPRKFLFGWMPPHPTFFVRKEVYQRLGTFNTQLRTAADYELMLRFLYKARTSVTYLPRVLVKMRAGGMSNASLSNRLRANREDREAWRVNQLKPHFYTALLKPVRKLTQFLRKPNYTI